MSRHKHWLEMLPEQGRIIESKAREIISLNIQIENMEMSLADLKNHRDNLEYQALELARQCWNEGEIQQAKSDVHKMSC